MRRTRRALGIATALALAATALGPFTGPVPAATPEVVVYSARHYGQEPAFQAFTKKTGIEIKILNGSTGEMFERLKAEGDKTSADVLLTVDAGNLWNAARAGLLSKVDSPELVANIPANLRDPENRWFGLTVRARTIMYNTGKVKSSELSTYEALGDPKWKGRLCLRQSGYIYNQSLIATMIKRHGEARTEEIVKGWAANQPILINGDTKILEAIAAGQCDVGITNHYYLARILAKDPAFPVAPFWANQATTGTHVNVSGAGITAHAKNRANAIKLLEFLSSPEAQQMFADVSMEYPVNPQASLNPIVAKWGKFKQDDINIAAAGEFQAAATKLADRAGYKSPGGSFTVGGPRTGPPSPPRSSRLRDAAPRLDSPVRVPHARAGRRGPSSRSAWWPSWLCRW
jgi:iron(III) transport system substrate-binding protein